MGDPQEHDGLLDDLGNFDDDLEGFFSTPAIPPSSPDRCYSSESRTAQVPKDSGSNNDLDLVPLPAQVGDPTPMEPEELLASPEFLKGLSTEDPPHIPATSSSSTAATPPPVFGGSGGSRSSTAPKLAPAEVVNATAAKLLRKLRPWSEFLLPISAPAQVDVFSRLTGNLKAFQINYAVLFVFAMLLGILMEPAGLLSAACVLAVWGYFIKKDDDPEWAPEIFGVNLSKTQRWLLLTAITAACLTLWDGGLILHTAAICVCVGILHAVVHDPSAAGIPSSSDNFADEVL